MNTIVQKFAGPLAPGVKDLVTDILPFGPIRLFLLFPPFRQFFLSITSHGRQNGGTKRAGQGVWPPLGVGLEMASGRGCVAVGTAVASF